MFFLSMHAFKRNCFGLLLTAGMLMTFTAMSQTDASLCHTTHLVLKIISAHHYNPSAFEAAARREVVDLFMEEFDPRGFYFLSSDKKVLYNVVDTDGVNIFCKAMDKATLLYWQRALQTDSFISGYLKTPLKFDGSDTIFYKPGRKHELADDWAAQKKRIAKRLKFEVLMLMYELQDDSAQTISDAAAEEKARKQVLKEFTGKNFLEKGKLENKIAEGFWNAIVLRCDPHSSYFNDNEKSGFDKQLSAQELSYGLIIQENDKGEIEIVRLIPGSAAWKTNELHEGDIITALSTPEGKRIDISTMTEEEINELIESARYKKMFFTIKKKNMQEKKVAVVPEKIQSETNVISSYVL